MSEEIKTAVNNSEAQLEKDVFRSITHTSLKQKIWIGILLLIFLAGIFSYIIQLRNGLVVTAMRDYVSWRLYIAIFIFFIGIIF